MTDSFREENDVPVVGNYDVIVVGGGVAGVSAAVAARRRGSSTLIVEKGVMLGGLATLGLVAIYLPLCDGNGRKVIGGIAEELLHLSIKYAYDSLPVIWGGTCECDEKARYKTKFSPAEFVIALDELIEDEGIDVLYDSTFSNVVVDGGHCRGIVVDNRAGRTGYKGKVFVDTTGDALVMAGAGAECVEAENWLSYWAYTTNLSRMASALEAGDVSKGIHLQWYGGLDDGRGLPEGTRKYKGTDPNEVGRFVADGRKLVRAGLDKKNALVSAVLTIPAMPQFRTTRRIRGSYELTERDIFTHFDDSIGCTGDWRKRGPIFEIPYRTLVADGIDNLITAGRTIGSAGDAWEVTRVIPPASMTGQAAGTAAVLSLRGDCAIDEIDVTDLQHELERDGVLIHF